MKAEVKKMGNSYGIVLPKGLVREYELRIGEPIEFLLIKKEPIDGFGMLRGKKIKPFKRERDLLGRGM